MSKKKRHAPIQQLREAGKEAQRLLVSRGIHTEESAIDRILNDRKIVLPGIPAYLPHAWTLQFGRFILMDIIAGWHNETIGESTRKEDSLAFFTFMVKELEKLRLKAKADIDRVPSLIRSMAADGVMLGVLKGPHDRYERWDAMEKFLVESYAVSIVVKENGSTSSFCEWFYEWTHEMESYWNKNTKKDQ